ncbi:hypothetical protein COO60DRAFT_1473522 [Scenedesmus sp. NREL 46B-D3]|nr:hypothetical protein COO60DRAFT_1473522 [Scenedesmus sp. NREL 46B-D3]
MLRRTNKLILQSLGWLAGWLTLYMHVMVDVDIDTNACVCTTTAHGAGQLLRACSECGLRLTPGSREARQAGLQEKDAAMEGAVCADLALLCGNFLVASSRWNRAAGAGAALVRLSEVTDWEEGGRTAAAHVARIFKREAPEGERRVLVARWQGLQGVMWVDGGDNRTEPPLLPDFSTVEGVQAAARQPYAHLHASLLHALAGPHAEVAEQPGAQALSATGLGLEQARSIDPVFSVTMQRTLQALRMFTFS